MFDKQDGDAAIRESVNRILSGKKLSDSSGTEFEDIRPGEEVILTLEDEICRNFYRFFDQEVRRSMLDFQARKTTLGDNSTIADVKSFDNDLQNSKRRLESLGDIFWGLVRELHPAFNLYQHPSIGIRTGWKIVKLAPRGPSILDLFGLSPGSFPPDPDEDDTQ